MYLQISFIFILSTQLSFLLFLNDQTEVINHRSPLSSWIVGSTSLVHRSLHCCFVFFLLRAPRVLALHFVQGLPDSDVGKYAFTFQGMDYRITTVIQYDTRLRHFVTWVACADGEWAISLTILLISFQGNATILGLVCHSSNYICLMQWFYCSEWLISSGRDLVLHWGGKGF